MNIYNTDCKGNLGLCKSETREKFWLDDPSELYKNDNYTKFMPKYEMTRNQQLNSITRMGIYMILIILIFNRGENLLFVPITLILIAILLKKFNDYDEMGKTKELGKILGIRQEHKNAEEIAKNIEYKYDDASTLKTYSELEKQDDSERDKIYSIESGIYDSDNSLHLGTKQKPSNYLRDKAESLYTVDEMIDYEKNTCRRPTPDNPLMNPGVTEYGTYDPPVACNSDDEEIKESIKVNFNHELFRDVDELWERENSQRQFYTMPNTGVPNKQNEFAEWLYKLPTSSICKEDTTACYRYSNLRDRIR